MRWWMSVVALVLVVVAAQVAPAPAEAADEEPVAPIEWAPCDGGECATYRVPLDHSVADGPQVSLALWRAPATGDPADRIGSMFVNPGGPGASGVGFAKLAASVLSDEVRARFDIVGFDPRGVGSSSPAVDCEPTSEPTPDDGDWAGYFAERREATAELDAACAIASGRLRDRIGTNQVAADLDLLRRAVGDDALTYWGGSYGTRIGYTYAATYPSRVRAIVLDGSVDPASDVVGFMYERGGSYDVAYDFFRSEHPTVAEKMDAIFAEFGDGAERIHLDGADVDIDAAMFGAKIYGSLSSEDAWASIAEFIDDAYASIVADVPTPVTSPDEDLATDNDEVPDDEPETDDDPSPAPRPSNNSMTVLRNVNCVDLGPGNSAAAPSLAAEMVEAGPNFGWLMATALQLCDTFPVQRDLIPSSVPASVPPVLIVGSVHDPATPYVWAQRMHAALDGSRLVTYGGAAHVAWNFTKSACVDSAVNAYVLTGNPPAGDLTCEFVSPISP
jgi:pimeloyl-ACP methyl ester carboxylesterase